MSKFSLKRPAKRIHFDRLHSFREHLGVLAGTSLGAGLFPWAPGTMGALVGLPICYFTNDAPPLFKLALWSSVAVLGVWAANVIDAAMGSADNQSIVIDETLGVGITAWTASTNCWSLFAAFILFRFFDIVKPWPVRAIDRWSKKQAKISPFWGGFGVMADDAVAGIQGLLVVLLFQYFNILH